MFVNVECGRPLNILHLFNDGLGRKPNPANKFGHRLEKKKRTREGGFNKGLMYIRNATNLCKHISVFVIA